MARTVIGVEEKQLVTHLWMRESVCGRNAFPEQYRRVVSQHPLSPKTRADKKDSNEILGQQTQPQP